MRTTTRIGALAVATTAALTMTTAPAIAGGKAASGCSSPYTLAYIGNPGDPYPDSIDAFSQVLVGPDKPFPDNQAVLDLLNSLDHNHDSQLCWKLPPGWLGPPATNAAQLAGFVNLVDDKIIGG